MINSRNRVAMLSLKIMLLLTVFFAFTLAILSFSDNKSFAASQATCEINGLMNNGDNDGDDFTNRHECLNYNVSAADNPCVPMSTRCNGKTRVCVVSGGNILDPSNRTYSWSPYMWPDEIETYISGALLLQVDGSFCGSGTGGGGGGGGPAPANPTVSCSPNPATSPATFSYSYTNAPSNSTLSWGVGSATVSGSGNGTTGPISSSNNATITFRLGSATASCGIGVPVIPQGGEVQYCNNGSVATVSTYLYNLYGPDTYPPFPCDGGGGGETKNDQRIGFRCYPEYVNGVLVGEYLLISSGIGGPFSGSNIGRYQGLEVRNESTGDWDLFKPAVYRQEQPYRTQWRVEPGTEYVPGVTVFRSFSSQVPEGHYAPGQVPGISFYSPPATYDGAYCSPPPDEVDLPLNPS